MPPPNADHRDVATERTPTRPGFSVVVPAFDEEQGLGAMLDALGSALQVTDRLHEIVVVNDGSTDATPRILAARGDVRVVEHADNRGYGAALKAGIRVAIHPIIVVVDADGTYPVAAIPGLVDGCATAAMVVGARIGPNVHSAPARLAVKWWFRQFAQWITGASIPDLNSGLRAFHKDLAERFVPLLPDGFSFTTTITVASLLERRPVRFERIDYMPRIGRSKVHPIRDTARIARQLVRLGARFAPLRTSLTVALPLFAVGLALTLYDAATAAPVGVRDLAWWAAGGLALGAGLAAEVRVRRRRAIAGPDLVASWIR